MAHLKTCQYEDCKERVYARCYCRKHYNMLWRKGTVGKAHVLNADEEGLRMDEVERLRSYERELKRAEQMYAVVCGLEGRVKWRREIDTVKTEIAKIKSNAKVAQETIVEVNDKKEKAIKS
jgi:hypothetical protein